MELLDKLKKLQKDNIFIKDEILKITDEDNLFFIITEALQNEKANYNTLYDVFENIREMAHEAGGLNIFAENLTLKFFFLSNVYQIDMIVFEALGVLIPPVYLDFLLDKRFLSEDEFAVYYFKKYKEFKADNELSMIKALNGLDTTAIKLEGEELAKQFELIREKLGVQ